MPPRQPIYLLGAHGGYAPLKAPLGGGATIFECLIEAWKDSPNLQLHPLSPGPEYSELHPYLNRHWSPRRKNLHQHHPASLGYGDYAQFSRAFEFATTEFLLEQPSAHSWVIANDICEGPDVLRLKQHGYKVITLVHVDVVEFISNLYLKSILSAPFMTRTWRLLRKTGLTQINHDIAKLIFDKQESAYRHSDLIVVPAAPMKKVILNCYPDLDPSKIRVIPWGFPALTPPEVPSENVIAQYRTQWKIPADAFILLTLSRISPEKGIDRLLHGLIQLERTTPHLAAGCCLIIAGSAAYMDGPSYLRKLQKLAGQLSKIQIRFVDHLLGEAKATAFAIADLYAFLSYHESYGLTLSEARQAGVPCLVSEEAGREAIPKEGITVTPTDATSLAQQIEMALQRPKAKSIPKMEFTFQTAAHQLKEIIFSS